MASVAENSYQHSTSLLENLVFGLRLSAHEEKILDSLLACMRVVDRV